MPPEPQTTPVVRATSRSAPGYNSLRRVIVTGVTGRVGEGTGELGMIADEFGRTRLPDLGGVLQGFQVLRQVALLIRSEPQIQLVIVTGDDICERGRGAVMEVRRMRPQAV